MILDKDHTDGWKHIGEGDMVVREGVATTVSPTGEKGGLYWYGKTSFGDFILRLEFKMDTETSNSGIFVRFPDPQGNYAVAAEKGYEIDIYGSKTGTIVFLPNRLRPTVSVPLHPDEWNECEVAVIGQTYTVKLKGQKVIEYTGDRALTGYIGFQNWEGQGEVHFRNVRIEELPTARADAGTASGAPAKAEQTCIEILSEQAPNALEWALAPLDRATPPDIRRNLMNLREDLLDEAAKKPAASAEAYKLGQELCNDLIDTLNERDKMLVRAGYTAAQSKVNMGEITNQALEARRSAAAPSGWHASGAMAWPTYQREKDQREELRKVKENGAALEKQRPILEWAGRSAQVREIVDTLYAQYRAAARKPSSLK